MHNAAAPARFFSLRTLLGTLVGVLVALFYVVLFHQPGQFTSTLSLVFAILVSKLSAPKHLAGLGALVGFPVGFVVGTQYVLEHPGQANPITALILAYFFVSFFMVYLTMLYSLLGFIFAQLMKLYKKRAIF